MFGNDVSVTEILMYVNILSKKSCASCDMNNFRKNHDINKAAHRICYSKDVVKTDEGFFFER